MPVVNQQNANAQPMPSSDPASRIKRVTEIPRDKIHMVVYGQTKTGKTRLLASFPKPVLIIATEDGTDSIANVEGVDIVRIRNTSEIGYFAQYANKKGYKTTGLDNATQAQQMRLAEMLGYEQIPLQMPKGVMERIDNQAYSLETKGMLNQMFHFQGNVVFLAHEKDQNSEQKGDLITPHVTASLSRGVAEWLNGVCKHICQTFIREQMKLEQYAEDGEPTAVGTGKGEYCLRIGPHPIYKAGLRIPVGYQMPDVILNPTYDKIKYILDGKYKPPTPETQVPQQTS